MAYNPNVQPMDPTAYLAQLSSALRSMQPKEESDLLRNARLYYKHGLDKMHDPNGPNLEAPKGLAAMYGQGAALKGAAKSAVGSAAMSM